MKTGALEPQNVTPDTVGEFDADRKLEGSQPATGIGAIGLAASDEITGLSVGADKVSIIMPWDKTLSEVMASVSLVGTGSVITVDIKKDGVSILSTLLTIDPSEDSSITAATPAVIDDAVLTKGDKVTVDITTVGSTIPGAGLKVWLI